jgi:Flp pilus assembly protein TadB
MEAGDVGRRVRVGRGGMTPAAVFVAASKSAHNNPVQWSTLAWVVGAVVVAAAVIAVIFLVSRRPKSMEHGIDEFSRSLQAVAPNHRAGARPPAASHVRPSNGRPYEERPVRPARGETGSV